MHQTFIYYGSLGKRKTVDRLFVTGGSAFFPKLVNYIATELDIEAEILNPLRTIQVAEVISQQSKAMNVIAPQLIHAIGLALR